MSTSPSGKKKIIFYVFSAAIMLATAGYYYFTSLSDLNSLAEKESLSSRQISILQSVVKDVALMSTGSDSLSVHSENEYGFKDRFLRWEVTHRALEYGDEALGISAGNSAAANEIFSKLNPSFSALHSEITGISNSTSESDRGNLAQVIELATVYEREMLNLVFCYSEEHSRVLANLRWFGLIFGALIIVFTWLAFRLFIGPIVRRLAQSNEELRQVNESLNRQAKRNALFIAGAGAELCKPLDAISGEIGELLAEAAIDSQYKRRLMPIQSAISTTRDLVDGIFDYTRLSAGALSLHPKPFRLSATVDEACDILKPYLAVKKTELVKSYSRNIPDTIIQDPVRLKQAVSNFLGLAANYGTSGEISLATEYMNEEAGFVQLRFGIHFQCSESAAVKLSQLLSPAGRESESSADFANSEALMISNSREIIELMNGRISCDGKHSPAFSIFFTVVAERGSTDEITLPEIEHLRGKKALVVDDNKTNLKVLVKLLSTWGIQATPFNSPDLVSDMLDALTRFDFCLVDMDMPNVDGREIAKRIREEYPLERIPVIALASAGNPLVNNREDYFESALEKPVRQDALLRVLTRIFASGSPGKVKNQPLISASPGFSGINVLIAEDNPLHQAVAESTLRKMGFSTDHASSAEEMLQKLGKQHFDLVLYDPALRDLEPGNAVRRLRSLSAREEEAPVLIGIRSEEKIPEEVFQSMDDTLKAPFNLDDFVRKMWDWFSEE